MEKLSQLDHFASPVTGGEEERDAWKNGGRENHPLHIEVEGSGQFKETPSA
jgi:hypothetical protein